MLPLSRAQIEMRDYNGSSSQKFYIGGTSNTPPTISLTSPVNNATFTAPATINITANATDGNGTISNVQFYNGDDLLVSDVTSPYSFSWTNVSDGTYTITARATDNNGAVTISAAVTVVISSSVIIQGESACSVDGILLESTNAGFRGDGYLNTANAVGSSATWALNASMAQTIQVIFRYANASSNNRNISVKVNGTTQLANVDFLTTEAWTTWSTVSFSLNLAAGNNTLQIIALTAEGAANLDEITFTGIGVTSASCPSSMTRMALPETALQQTIVAPNPSEDLFYITASESIKSIKIIDHKTGLIRLTSGALANGEHLNFGSNLSSGFYILVIQYKNGRIEKRKILKLI